MFGLLINKNKKLTCYKKNNQDIYRQLTDEKFKMKLMNKIKICNKS